MPVYHHIYILYIYTHHIFSSFIHTKHKLTLLCGIICLLIYTLPCSKRLAVFQIGVYKQGSSTVPSGGQTIQHQRSDLKDVSLSLFFLN